MLWSCAAVLVAEGQLCLQRRSQEQGEVSHYYQPIPTGLIQKVTANLTKNKEKKKQLPHGLQDNAWDKYLLGLPLKRGIDLAKLGLLASMHFIRILGWVHTKVYRRRMDVDSTPNIAPITTRFPGPIYWNGNSPLVNLDAAEFRPWTSNPHCGNPRMVM